MNCAYVPAKLLVSIVGRHRGERIVSIAKQAGARGGTIAFGRASGDNRILQMLSLDDVPQDVVFTLMLGEAEKVIGALTAACRAAPQKLGGISLLLDVSGMFIRLPAGTQNQTARLPGAGSEHMGSGYTLITVIVNHGYADDVMQAARKAGAKGGTILNARGTGTEKDVRFFGISLVPEKEMLLIVTAESKVQAILDAVNAVPRLCEPGGGVAFSMNVERFILLGQDNAALPPAV